jgi:hypothetical protein
MLNKNARKWVEALRSGKFKQSRFVLRNEEGFCCLGVACEVAVREGVIPEARAGKDRYDYDNEISSLPERVQNWLGLRTPYGYAEGYQSLESLNDSGEYSFEQIANVIESKPKGLFREAR